MEVYLIKSTAILAIFFGFYKLVLENENMHVFKRFYLLGSLPAAFLIPLITFTSYVEVPVSSTTVFFENSLTLPMQATEVSLNLWPFVLWSLYGLGVVFFAFKIGKNLNQLFSKIKNNPKFIRDSIHHILLKTPVVPHTFLNYVFLNKQKFEAKEISEEVIAHEHVHAKQKHSIDILLVELLQMVFWFNPLLYLIKRSIKLNHEFLADRAVLSKGTDAVTYQNLLLAFSSNATTPTLANSINYSFIKKRFTVMKKQTSTKAIWLRSLLLLPLLAILLVGFSSREIVVLQQNNTMDTNKTIQAINFYIDQDSEIYLNEKAIAFNEIDSEVNKLNTHLSVEEKQKYVRAEIAIEKESDRELAEEIWKVLYASNIWQMSISSLSAQREFGLKTPTNKMVGKTKVEAEILYQEMIKNRENKKDAEKQTDNPWSVDLSKSEIIIEKENKAHQKTATKAEIEEYNKLAKKYNTMSNDNLRINAEEVKRFSFLYHKMSLEQRKKAEPFPNVEGFPSAPPLPPISQLSDSNRDSWVKDFDNSFQKENLPSSSKSIIFKINDDESFSINGIPSSLENYKPTLKSLITKFENFDSDEEIKVFVKSENLVKLSFINEIGEELKKYNIVTIQVTSSILDDRNKKTPPTPPSPPNPNVGTKSPLPLLPATPPPAPLSDPIEYIKALHKSGAVFFIGPHQYNFEEVLEMAKKSDDLNIDVSEYPKVNLLGC